MIILQVVAVLGFWAGLGYLSELIFGYDGGMFVVFLVVFIIGVLGTFFINKWP